MIQLQQIIYFKKVAELNSMNKAADELYITQSNLSRSIKSLEDYLEIKLFERTNKGVTLTEDGKKFGAYADNILMQIDLMKNISVEETQRAISISAYPMMLNAEFVRRFYEYTKYETFNMVIDEQRINVVIDNVKKSISEIGIIQINMAQEKEVKRDLKNNALEFSMLTEGSWYAGMGENNPLYKKSFVTMEELINSTIIRAKDDYYSSLTEYMEVDGVKFTQFKNAIFSNDGVTRLYLLKNMNTFVFCPEWTKDEYARNNIKVIPIKNCNIHSTLGWIKRKKQSLSKEATIFVKIMEDYYSNTSN